MQSSSRVTFLCCRPMKASSTLSLTGCAKTCHNTQHTISTHWHIQHTHTGTHNTHIAHTFSRSFVYLRSKLPFEDLH